LYAVINDRSRQFTVRKGDEILCDLGPAFQEGETVTFDQVHLVSNEGDVKLGKPFLDGAQVKGEVVKGEVKGDKLIVFRFKRRKNVRVRQGHRQRYARVRIQEIEG
jgi:large subunit ribosomal protein L21